MDGLALPIDPSDDRNGGRGDRFIEPFESGEFGGLILGDEPCARVARKELEDERHAGKAQANVHH